MRWDELTGDLFPEAVQKAEGVCLLPLSCIERHGHHLPLATDMYIGREVCNRAAALESAIVFPDFIFTQILEARHYPGCIGIEPDLTIRLLENTFREMLTHVVFHSSIHRGNIMIGLREAGFAPPKIDYIIYLRETKYI